MRRNGRACSNERAGANQADQINLNWPQSPRLDVNQIEENKNFQRAAAVPLQRLDYDQIVRRAQA